MPRRNARQAWKSSHSPTKQESQNMKYAMQKTWFITAPAGGLALKSQKLPCRPAIRLWQLAAAAQSSAKHSGRITNVFSRSRSTLRTRIRRKRPSSLASRDDIQTIVDYFDVEPFRRQSYPESASNNAR